jgi:hypothetical protein
MDTKAFEDVVSKHRRLHWNIEGKYDIDKNPSGDRLMYSVMR